MLKTLTIGKKIGLGFALILCLTVVTGAAGYIALARVTESLDVLNWIHSAQRLMTSANQHFDQYMLNNYIQGRDLQEEAKHNLNKDVRKLLDSVDRFRLGAGRGDQWRALTEDISSGINEFKTLFDQYDRAETEKEELERRLRENAVRIGELAEKGSFLIEDLQKQNELAAVAVSAYCDRNADVRFDRAKTALAELKSEIDAWYELIRNSDAHRAIGDEVRKLFEAHQALFQDYFENVSAQKDVKARLSTVKQDLNHAFFTAADTVERRLAQVKKVSFRLITGVILGALAFGMLYSLLFVRSILRSMLGVIGELADVVARSIHVSGEVASSSGEISQGASEQAAHMQETSSSLEQMSAMTHRNAEHSASADALMKETEQAVRDADQAMNALTESMNAIMNTSEKIEKIVKSIDEIAFQTNLLSLNAMVEAARAGEAGGGFAVVAGEVRSLSVKAAASAKNTTGLIQETVEEIRRGFDVAAAANDAFKKVVRNSSSVGTLVSDIAAASDQQARGIEQINLAVADMEKVIQRNAEGAELSASASGEMKNHADQLQECVMTLIRLVGVSEKAAGIKTGNLGINSEARFFKPAEAGYTQTNRF